MARMHKAWVVTAAVAVACSAGQATAQNSPQDALKDLPGWKIPEICAKDSAQAHCLVLESRAWRTVSGSWVSLPNSVRAKCLVETNKIKTDNSWRVLNDCVDEEMEKAGDKRAVQTERTPSEAVPPPKPVTVAVVAPPPPVVPAPVVPAPVVPAPVPALAPIPAPAAPALATPASVAVPAPILGMPTAPPPFATDVEADLKRKADADAKAKAEAAVAKTLADAELARVEAARKAAAETEAKRLADAESARKAVVDAAAKACQDDLQQIARDGVIQFRFASAALDGQSQPTLDKLVAAVKACPGKLVIVEGHTDAVGEPETNLNLSRNRAQTVVDYLAKAGLPASLIKAEGYGAARPAADNATPEGRAKNRRIGFKVEAQ
jgi:OmpA-OmpF porin, OOP family